MKKNAGRYVNVTTARSNAAKPVTHRNNLCSWARWDQRARNSPGAFLCDPLTPGARQRGEFDGMGFDSPRP